MSRSPPIIGISACLKTSDQLAYHSVYHKYVSVVLRLGALPVIIPSVGDKIDLEPLLDRVDGLLLTGSPSNVQPQLYNRELCSPDSPLDCSRDATTLPLIRAAVARGVPIFAICRGLQELNVALGGTLHQELHKLEGRLTHFLGKDKPLDVMYGPAHEIDIQPNSWLLDWVKQNKIRVNSIHTQAIDELSPHLAAEAFADDGTIEAARVTDGDGFAYGVQWHPEHDYERNLVSQALFAAFRSAVTEYTARG